MMVRRNNNLSIAPQKGYVCFMLFMFYVYTGKPLAVLEKFILGKVYTNGKVYTRLAMHMLVIQEENNNLLFSLT